MSYFDDKTVLHAAQLAFSLMKGSGREIIQLPGGQWLVAINPGAAAVQKAKKQEAPTQAAQVVPSSVKRGRGRPRKDVEAGLDSK